MDMFDYKEKAKKLQNEILLNGTIFELVKEYCGLATKKLPTRQEEQRMKELLIESQTNAALDFWINEVDHFLDHELGLITGTTIYPIETENLKSLLLKHLDLDYQQTQLIDGLNEECDIQIDVIPSRIPEVQSSLKDRGLYPGAVDGIAGCLTVEALKKFQLQNNLEPSGRIDGTTLIALDRPMIA